MPMDEFASRAYPVKEHMRFQRRTWLIERVGWATLAAIALLALTGLFGIGWLSKAKVAGDGLAIDYERFERATRLAEFTFHFGPGQGERNLHLNRTFQKNYEITSILPAPVRAEAGGDGLMMTFAVPPSGGAVVLWAHPRSYGISHLEARAGDGPPLSFSIMVYP